MQDTHNFGRVMPGSCLDGHRAYDVRAHPSRKPGADVSNKKVQKAHIAASLPNLHRSLIDIATTMIRPERDAAMLEMAGLPLERALFPLLVLVEHLGPIGVVDL